MIWVTMLGAGLVMRYGGHIAVTFVISRLRHGPMFVVLWTSRILIIFFLALLLWFGADMTGRAGRQRSAALEWSMSVPNFAIPLGAALMLYHMGVAMIRREDRGVPPPGLPFLSTKVRKEP
jgi:TRAP-type C4-dicarboxylate transport system permease small subunit